MEDSEAYQIRRGHPNLLANPEYAPEKDWITVTKSDFKKPPPLEHPKTRGKRAEVYEKFLYEEISRKVAREVFRPRTPPDYNTSHREHFAAPAGFDPDKEFSPNPDRSVYLEQPITYWSENRRKVHGVSTTNGKGTRFPIWRGFTKPLGARLEDVEY